MHRWPRCLEVDKRPLGKIQKQEWCSGAPQAESLFIAVINLQLPVLNCVAFALIWFSSLSAWKQASYLCQRPSSWRGTPKWTGLPVSNSLYGFELCQLPSWKVSGLESRGSDPVTPPVSVSGREVLQELSRVATSSSVPTFQVQRCCHQCWVAKGKGSQVYLIWYISTKKLIGLPSKVISNSKFRISESSGQWF